MTPTTQHCKTLIICETFPGYGGVERATVLLANYLTEHGESVSIVSARKGDDKPAAALDKRVEIIDLGLAGGRESNSSRNLDRIEAYIRGNNIDVVVNQGLFSKIATRFTPPHTHNKDNILIINTLHTELFGNCYYVPPISDIRGGSLRARRLKRLKKLLLRHIAPWRKKPKLKRQYRFHHATCDAMVVLHDAAAGAMASLTDGDRDGKLHTISNWLSPRNGDTCSAPRKRQAVYVGRLERSLKRVDRLIDIWAKVERRHPEWQLVIVGDGPDREALEERAFRRGLCNIRFDGFSADPSEYYATASILCLTSQSEGQPLVVMEAQQAGCVPVVFASFAGAESMIDDGVDGILVKPFSRKEFASKLGSLMSSPERLAGLSRGAVAKSARYTADLCGRQWAELIDGLRRKRDGK